MVMLKVKVVQTFFQIDIFRRPLRPWSRWHVTVPAEAQSANCEYKTNTIGTPSVENRISHINLETLELR